MAEPLLPGVPGVPDVPAAPRPAIRAAWGRAASAGLAPTDHPDPSRVRDVDARSRLVLAARPVLDELAAALADTRFALVLADRRARVVDHRVGAHPLRDRLAEVGLVTGTVWDERTTGTNAVATVFEVRRGLSVVGDEHYLDDLKQFCCYGEPLFDPTSGRLEGVLDITGPVADATSLLGPFLARARHDIEQRLLDTSRAAHQRLLRAYEAAAAGARHPVLALGEDMMLANQPATTRLTRDDIAVLRAVVAGGGSGVAVVHLAGDVPVRVECTVVAPGAAVVALRSAPAVAARTVATAGRRPVAAAPAVLLVGESGTGRTTEAAARVGADAVRLDAADVAERPEGEAAWLAQVRDALASGRDVLLDDVHLLPPGATTRLRSTLRRHRGAGRVVATCAPLDGAGADAAPLAALAALFDEHVALRPLREDRERIPRLVTAMLGELGGPDVGRVGADLAEHLARAPWPGNLHELRAVAEHLAAVPAAGELTVADLPPRYRDAPWSRAMTPLERSEYDTIVTALRACAGNKALAARRLGISRGTLYSRMRRFRIPG